MKDKLCWFALAVLGLAMAMFLAMTQGAFAEPLNVCIEMNDAYDVMIGAYADKPVWDMKMEQEKCAPVDLPNFPYRVLSHLGEYELVESKMLFKHWESVYGVAQTGAYPFIPVTDLDGQWDNSPNAAWYKKQVPTPQTLKIYGIEWGSCCDHGDVCQECVIHHFSNKPPWADGWYYEKDGKLFQLPPHIVDYVPWTPTGKPVLFIAPWDSGKMKKGDPVCLKVPGGSV